MIEVCDICGCEVALLHPASLLRLIQTVGQDQADRWRDCYLCASWVRRWSVTFDA